MRGPDAEKAHKQRLEDGYYQKYLSGKGLDIGPKGTNVQAADETITPGAIGVDLDFPNYDGTHLPFHDCSQDFVYAGHILEHTDNPLEVLREWHRVVKVGGFIWVCLPHAHRYAKRKQWPDPWCHDHKRIYTPGSALAEVEQALQVNSYIIVHLRDWIDNFDWNKGPYTNPDYFKERYEFEFILQKIKPPKWNIV